MTPLEAQALLIRHRAAMDIVRDSTDPIELLGMVVCPSEDVLRASLAAAKREGVSAEARQSATRHTLARELKRMEKSESPVARQLARRGVPAVVGLGDLG